MEVSGPGPAPGPADDPRRPLAAADRRLLAAARALGDVSPVARAARGLSTAGDHGAVWLAAGLAAAALDPHRRGPWLRATALVAGAHLGSMAVKRIVRRPRPEPPGGPLVRTAGRHSFPSSHAASAAAAAVAFRSLAPCPPAVAAAALGMCASRLVVGVHYPSDVLAGAAFGAVAATLGRTWATGEARHG
ncbi:putative membrane-associated phospholipid phosphatase [Actinacidiphila reveromycinica]|uniref:Putative membrane-associated phospholipid phosphatase n=1 Tax=Actinacidiphila reveromycinica TaxID=659352 RepID=A0A7U3V0S0_9ACTN|nr:phosphatase PAP2 family protein [Streptomyces sp. SN-593]BBB02240.1 putative membrane-associated phospholipid phosphatase [Streptomyces sp. SN-593]